MYERAYISIGSNPIGTPKTLYMKLLKLLALILSIISLIVALTATKAKAQSTKPTNKVHWISIPAPDSIIYHPDTTNTALERLEGGRLPHGGILTPASMYLVNGVRQDSCPLSHINPKYIKSMKIEHTCCGDIVHLTVNRRHVIVTTNSFSIK